MVHEPPLTVSALISVVQEHLKKGMKFVLLSSVYKSHNFACAKWYKEKNVYVAHNIIIHNIMGKIFNDNIIIIVITYTHYIDGIM